MKKSIILFTAIFILTALNVHAKYGKSTLNLKLWNNSSFEVFLDNQPFDETNNFYLGDMKPGLHELKVVSVQRTGHWNGGFKKLMYRGTIEIPKNAEVIATVKPNKRIALNVVKKKAPRPYANNYYKPGAGRQKQVANLNNNRGRRNNGSYAYVIQNNDLNRLLRRMNSTQFDNARMSIVRQSLNQHKFTTDQVALIMSRFKFESNKLQFAKLAYNRTVDKENYFLVKDELSYRSSVNDLNNYVFAY